MVARIIQHSFNSGEWSPNLWARTDLEKYHSGAAIMRNFFTDYRGGASTRAGTKWCMRGHQDTLPIRLIPFQATFNLGFAVEFGNFYARFYQNGSPILESGINITGITNANPCVVTVANTYNLTDNVFISGVGGMTQLNGRYFTIIAQNAGAISLGDIFGNPIDSTTFGVYSGGGATQRVYTIASPYAAGDLALVKYAQNVTELVLCHPNYQPYVLVFGGLTGWTLTPLVIGTTIAAPSGVSATSTLAAGTTCYGYIVTTIDGNGQESAPSAVAALNNVGNIATVLGTNTISWSGVPGAASYNVYKATSSQFNPVATGVPYGFIGNVTGLFIQDSNITPEFTISPPVPRNPFASTLGVSAANITAKGSYNAPAPTVSFSGGGGSGAAGFPIMSAVSVGLAASGTGYAIGDTVLFSDGLLIEVLTLTGSAINTFAVLNPGATATIPANPLSQLTTSGSGSGGQVTVQWGVIAITITAPGSYASAPTIGFSAGAAAATAILGPGGTGNPSVPAFFQQRLVLAGPNAAPQTFYMSQPGLFGNFNVSSPIQSDDAITGSIISGQLNTIKAMVNQPAGLIILTDGSSWLLNGGSFGAAVTPAALVANAQSFNGANDMPPIVVVFDMLYVQSKGSVVRDSLYNFYANVYTGTDISILSSHLFFGFQLKEWAFAEEPFKVVWAVRNDGVLLALTFLKEQDFIAWTHHDTAGAFQSVCSIIETTSEGPVNALYTVVTRNVSGTPVQYIERMAERFFQGQVKNAWTVDCGFQYNGSPTTNFHGAEALSGSTVTGLADGVPITPFVMPASGQFTLGTPASLVTVGLAFLPQLQTLLIDTGKPTTQGKQKKIPAVVARVVDTLGLSVGSSFSSLVDVQDLILGNIGSLTNQKVTGLVTGDVRSILDPLWSEQGQYCFQQNLPYPATILGVIPEIMVDPR